MFWNIYSKRVLCTLRNKEMLVWTWLFPLVLSTLFFFTFGSLDTAGMLSRFPLGVVDDAAYRDDAALRSALEAVSGDDGLFELIVIPDDAQADAALENGEIEGYILAGDTPVLTVAGDGINQTIAKSFLDQYVRTRSVVGSILLDNPAAARDLPALLEQSDYTREISLSRNPPTNKVGYFYALLAMVCMYGGFQSLSSTMYMQANLSAMGARRTLAPTGRLWMVLFDLLGCITVQFVCMVTVVAYIVYILGIDFNSNLGLVLLACLAGSILGVAFGALISVSSKLKEQAKVAVMITLTMVCSFLSGLMVGGINYIVAEHAPIVSWLNPAARIADAFYCLYYYDTYDKYFLNIGIILVMSAVMIIITSFFLRRQRYESI